MACRIFPYQREYIHIYRERGGEVFLVVCIDEVGYLNIEINVLFSFVLLL